MWILLFTLVFLSLPIFFFSFLFLLPSHSLCNTPTIREPAANVSRVLLPSWRIADSPSTRARPSTSLSTLPNERGKKHWENQFQFLYTSLPHSVCAHISSLLKFIYIYIYIKAYIEYLIFKMTLVHKVNL